MPPGCSWHPRLHQSHLLPLAPHPQQGLLPPHPSPHIFGSRHRPHAPAQLCHCQSSSRLPRHQELLKCDTVGDIPRCQPSVTQCPLRWDGTGGVSGHGCPSQGVPGAASLPGDGGSQPGPQPDPSKSNQSRNSSVGETRAGNRHGNRVSASRAVAAPGAGGTERWPRWDGHSRMAQSNGHKRVAATGWPRWDGHGNASTGHPDLSGPVG